MNIRDVTLVCDTSILADGDVICDTAEVQNVSPGAGTAVMLESVILTDEDDQGVALDLVFLRANASLGTKNAAPDIADASARDILGTVRIATTDYQDLGGVRIATLRDVGLALSSLLGTSIFVSAITRGGTPTYTAAGLKLRLGFRPM